MSKLLICLILLIPFVASLQITEVELNPFGGRENVEWIELYNPSDQPINLSFWKIHDDLKERFTFTPNSTISGKEYYIIEFNSPVLNNGGDSVFLYNQNNNLVDKIENLKEITSSSKTYQLCKGDWIFQEQTKNKINCEEKPAEKEFQTEKSTEFDEEKPENQKDSKIKKEKIKNFNKTNEPIIQETIKLNPKTIKTENDNQTIREKGYAKYSIAIFCVLLLSLYIIKPKKKKNEWQ